MRVDRLTKVLLAAIAIALWINALNPWIRPVPAQAQMSDAYLSSINNNIRAIAMGVCVNSKLC